MSRPVACLLIAFLLNGCAGPPPTWKVGFWQWADATPDNTEIDSLYLQAFSRNVPKAREYWLVFRADRSPLPTAENFKETLWGLERARDDLKRQGLKVAGIQIDLDCPTGRLIDYADQLKEVRKLLLPGEQLSITALLDWFRSGTAIDRVVAAVDEFVPQFYDVDVRDYGNRIAVPIDAEKWAPIFNRLQKRYRIGISTFGRASIRGKYYGDLKPLDIGIQPAYQLKTERTSAQELRLQYTGPKDRVEFILSTPESIRSAYLAAKKMGQYCGGVLFFRWPTEREVMVPSAQEVLAAVNGVALPVSTSLKVRQGNCALTHCVDLFITATPPLNERAIPYRVQASNPLEYFLPNEKLPVKHPSPTQIEFTLPPYGGRGTIHLGRAVAKSKTSYTLEQ
jgi:hypothetical protein